MDYSQIRLNNRNVRSLMVHGLSALKKKKDFKRAKYCLNLLTDQIQQSAIKEQKHPTGTISNN